MYYVMTGRTFDGRKAAQMGVVNEAVPRAKLRAHTKALATELLGKNPTVLRAGKTAVRHVQGMAWELSDEYLQATAADLEALVRHVQATVERVHGVRLVPEVRMVGEAA